MGSHWGNLNRGDKWADLSFIKITLSIVLKGLLYLWMKEEGEESKKKAMRGKVRDDGDWTEGV